LLFLLILKGRSMLLRKALIPVSLLLLGTACAEKDSKKPDAPQSRPEIPLNAPTDVLGTWMHCTNTGSATSSAGIYTFGTDGALDFKSVIYQALDCKGEGAEQLAVPGSYIVGSGNALDLTLVQGEMANTLYRVFSVQGERLLISNNLGAGADADHRDYDLNAEALVLTKVAL
jgi:hypothetical protein